ncbi:MAG: DUF4404 family protein [Pirellulaceae bacterium]|nr:DUF4404 family protein [Pirellulaceae bacterium]
MTTEELSQTLRKLHEELSANPALDQSTINSLKSLLGEIQVAIDRAASEDSLQPALPITERIQSAITAFEARHPSLTLSLSKIADGLSAMGI